MTSKKETAQSSSKKTGSKSITNKILGEKLDQIIVGMNGIKSNQYITRDEQRKNRRTGLLIAGGIAGLYAVGWVGNCFIDKNNNNDVLNTVQDAHAVTDSTIITHADSTYQVIDVIDNKVDSVYETVLGVDNKVDSVYDQVKANGVLLDSVATKVYGIDSMITEALDEVVAYKKTMPTPRAVVPDAHKKAMAKKQARLDSLTDAGLFDFATDSVFENCLEDDLYNAPRGEQFSLKPLEKNSYMRAIEAEEKEAQNKFWLHKKQ
ncbi:hypothetical protein K9M74_04540 [Candidatus Woesearchaeota archaeon]|nr:hypothetical protein [Candidatus Woesearchaeota archaeon]